MEHYDLLIIGGGAAGLFAAWEASEAGVKNIALLESLKNTGGNSARAGGYLFSLETEQLRGSGMASGAAHGAWFSLPQLRGQEAGLIPVIAFPRG